MADLLRARAAHGLGDAAVAAWFTAQVARPRAEIDPPPLVTGDDLLTAGVPPGRGIGAALAKARQLQLDGLVTTPEEALAAVRGCRPIPPAALNGPSKPPGASRGDDAIHADWRGGVAWP